MVSGACGYPSLGGPERSVFIDYNGPNPGNPSADWECIAQNTSQNTLGIWYGGVCAFPTGNGGHRYEAAKASFHQDHAQGSSISCRSKPVDS
jgi:hypothetical protein